MVAPVVSVQSEDFDVAEETARITANNQDIGALVTFTGLCRDEGKRLSELELEHYPGMAEAEIYRICVSAIDRFGLVGLTVIHRFGKIVPGDNIVLVISAASHRQDAFDGASYVMDYLKTNAPFWKKEHLVSGEEGEWVSAREVDDMAKDSWQ